MPDIEINGTTPLLDCIQGTDDHYIDNHDNRAADEAWTLEGPNINPEHGPLRSDSEVLSSFVSLVFPKEKKVVGPTCDGSRVTMTLPEFGDISASVQEFWECIETSNALHTSITSFGYIHSDPISAAYPTIAMAFNDWLALGGASVGDFFGGFIQLHQRTVWHFSQAINPLQMTRWIPNLATLESIKAPPAPAPTTTTTTRPSLNNTGNWSVTNELARLGTNHLRMQNIRLEKELLVKSKIRDGTFERRPRRPRSSGGCHNGSKFAGRKSKGPGDQKNGPGRAGKGRRGERGSGDERDGRLTMFKIESS